jgi:aminoglycoside phosphotransferase (APT) family kinase protein
MTAQFYEYRPSAEALAWVEQVLGGGARVVACRRLTGGLTAAVHRLTVKRRRGSEVVVLRQYGKKQDVRREARVLDAVVAAGLPAPAVLAVSPGGAKAGGHPSILMTRLLGRVSLSPVDRDGWLKQIALAAARIHDASVAAPPFERWLDPARLTAPASSTRPDLWKRLRDVLREDGGSTSTCFIHRDFQHFNFLWTRGRLTGVVDWGAATIGPPSIDVGHCRLNLAVLFGADWAERLRLAYEAETGRSIDPWWDLHALASYGDAWQHFIPIQVDGRAPVDTGGMTARVEELLRASLRRLT